MSPARPTMPAGRLAGALALALLLAFGCVKPPPAPVPPPAPPVVAPSKYAPLTVAQALERVRQMHASTQSLGSWRDLAAVAGQASGRVWTRGAVERLTESPAFRELVAHYARAV